MDRHLHHVDIPPRHSEFPGAEFGDLEPDRTRLGREPDLERTGALSAAAFDPTPRLRASSGWRRNTSAETKAQGARLSELLLQVCGIVKHICAMLTLLLIFPGALHARECGAPAGAPSLSNIDSEVRLTFISHQLDSEIHSLHIWSWTWGGIYTSVAVTQVSILPWVSDGARIDLTVGAIAATVGSLSLFLLPLRIIQPARWVHQSMTELDRCHLLAESEQRFAEAAKFEAQARGWIAHAGNIAVNATLALILGLGYHRWTSAGISAGVGLAVGEATLLTQPHGLAQSLRQYRDGALGDTPPRATWNIAPVLSFGRTTEFGVSVTF